MNRRENLESVGTQSGFSFVEVLAVLILLGLVMVPAMRSLDGALQVEAINHDAIKNDYRLIDRAEVVLAEPFADVAKAALGENTPSSYSDPAGSANRRLVFVSRYDADNADSDNNDTTGADSGILKVTVRLEGAPSRITLLKVDV